MVGTSKEYTLSFWQLRAVNYTCILNIDLVYFMYLPLTYVDRKLPFETKFSFKTLAAVLGLSNLVRPKTYTCCKTTDSYLIEIIEEIVEDSDLLCIKKISRGEHVFLNLNFGNFSIELCVLL